MTHDGSPRNGGVARASRDVYALSCLSRLSQTSTIAVETLIIHAGRTPAH
jgi:hypothetical protein